MDRLGRLLLQAIGVLVVAFVVLSVIATIVGIAVSIVVGVVSLVLTIAVVALFALSIVGLVTLLRDGSNDAVETDGSARDPESRLRDRYVAGELTEAEFERELDRLLRSDERGDRFGRESGRPRELDRDRR